MEIPPAFLDALSQQIGDEGLYPDDAAPILHSSQPFDVDFVVVGGGASGAVVACRLAQAFPSDKILLVESGGDPPIISEVPALWVSLWQTTAWIYPCQERSDSTFSGLRAKRPLLIRGRVLGGTSTINGLPYLRGHPSDYDSWNIPGWAFQDVLPFFKRSEDMRDNSVLTTNPDYHSVGGELTIEPATGIDPLKNIIKRAGCEMGYQMVTDVNGPAEQCFGFGDIHRTQRNATRCSSAKAFLSLASGKKDNLLIARHCTATKICYDGETAKSISVQHNNEPITITVRKELVLAAGAIATPQLLLLSGVGPEEHLKEIGIPKVIDLPVGETFYDHAIFHGLVFTAPPLLQEEKSSDPFKEFLDERKGPLSTIGLMELMGFIKTESTQEWPYPSIQFNHARYRKGTFQSKLLSQEIEEAIQNINKDEDVIVMMVFLLHPKMSGKIRLRSNDPRELPVLESGLLNDPRDMTILLEAVRFVEEMSKGQCFSEAGVRLRYVEFPGAGDLVPGSGAYWEYAVRRMTSSAFHPVGTCPIGDVTDARLRLKGTTNVRVADASVIPLPLSANPNAPAIMVGERAAHFITEDFRGNDVGIVNKLGCKLFKTECSNSV